MDKEGQYKGSIIISTEALKQIDQRKTEQIITVPRTDKENRDNIYYLIKLESGDYRCEQRELKKEAPKELEPKFNKSHVTGKSGVKAQVTLPGIDQKAYTEFLQWQEFKRQQEAQPAPTLKRKVCRPKKK